MKKTSDEQLSEQKNACCTRNWGSGMTGSRTPAAELEGYLAAVKEPALKEVIALISRTCGIPLFRSRRGARV
jgi:hypothetical protein